jgi:hypothetical protein
MRYSLLGIIVVLMMGCSAGAEQASDSAEITGQARAALQTTADGCPLPAPPDRGCKTQCKPCLIAVCEGGEWVYEPIQSPGCGGSGGGGGGNPCTISIDQWCPPECSSCVIN